MRLPAGLQCAHESTCRSLPPLWLFNQCTSFRRVFVVPPNRARVGVFFDGLDFLPLFFESPPFPIQHKHPFRGFTAATKPRDYFLPYLIRSFLSPLRKNRFLLAAAGFPYPDQPSLQNSRFLCFFSPAQAHSISTIVTNTSSLLPFLSQDCRLLPLLPTERLL